MLIHVRFDGRSQDVSAQGLRLIRGATDAAIREAVSAWLGIEPERLTDYVIDRRPGGDVIVRPEAVYG